MTPSQIRRKLRSLERDLEQLSQQVGVIAESDAPALDKLAALHGCSPQVHSIREQIADCKGVLAARAKNDETHEAIAERLDVSKPYVQQMVYRGRAL